jgi:hypothetical protein
LGAVVTLFLLFDGGIKVLDLSVVRQTLEHLGYPADLGRFLGVLTVAIAALYAWPQTSVPGAILLTGLLGGAMATHLRAASPLFSHTLFGLYLGLMAWGSLFLRYPRVRSLLSLDRPD